MEKTEAATSTQLFVRPGYEPMTKLILHAIDATASGAAATVQINSPDIDMLVLALRQYPQLFDDTTFVISVGQRRRTVSLKPIFTTLGEEQAAALPRFHAMSRAANTGSFYGKEKTAC